MTPTRIYLLVALGLAAGNVLSALLTLVTWGAIFERMFFQCVALFVLWLVTRRLT